MEGSISHTGLLSVHQATPVVIGGQEEVILFPADPSK